MAEEAGEAPQEKRRGGSNIFGRFSKHQMQEFKEASKKAKEPARAERTSSNVFARFKQAQIQEFKEAFAMMDVDRDMIISLDDLREIFSNLGRIPTDADLKEMLSEAPGPLNFTMFLTLMGEKLHGTDTEDALRDAFHMFDVESSGKIPEAYLKDLLCNMGDNFSKEELKQSWKEIPLEKGMIDYNRFTCMIKGKMDDEQLSA